MGYLGNQPSTGDNNSFRVLDDISSHTRQFDGSSAAVVSTANDTITVVGHRFLTGQRVSYTTSGGSIGGLSSGTNYFIIKVSLNEIKLASSLANANNNIALNLSSVGTGTDHNITVAFDSINTRFKLTFGDGDFTAEVTKAPQLQVSVNGVIQQPQETMTPTVGYGIAAGDIIIFATAPAPTDVVWINVVANNFPSFDISDNHIDNFIANGTDTDFALSKEPANSQNVIVTLDGVVQYPSDNDTVRAYQLNGNVIAFTSAPGNGVAIQVRHIGFAGATSSDVTGVFGRTGNIGIIDTDPIVAIQSGGFGIGTVRTLNFIGLGNTFAKNGSTIDISIAGGGGGGSGAFTTSITGIQTSSNIVGVGTTTTDNTALQGVGNSARGLFISQGMILYENHLDGNHYIGTAFNGLMAGPVTINGVLSIDGNYVVV
ncbi:MAG: hypothetical protein ACXADH_10460 [Candidatus Kariarchaeaceae archaeon]|jgi:hypothetical protein